MLEVSVELGVRVYLRSFLAAIRKTSLNNSRIRVPSDTLVANWAYLVIAAQAWNLKAWMGLVLPARLGVRVYLRSFLAFATTLPPLQNYIAIENSNAIPFRNGGRPGGRSWGGPVRRLQQKCLEKSRAKRNKIREAAEDAHNHPLEGIAQHSGTKPPFLKRQP